MIVRVKPPSIFGMPLARKADREPHRYDCHRDHDPPHREPHAGKSHHWGLAWLDWRVSSLTHPFHVSASSGLARPFHLNSGLSLDPKGTSRSNSVRGSRPTSTSCWNRNRFLPNSAETQMVSGPGTRAVRVASRPSASV